MSRGWRPREDLSRVGPKVRPLASHCRPSSRYDGDMLMANRIVDQLFARVNPSRGLSWQIACLLLDGIITPWPSVVELVGVSSCLKI